MKQVGVRDLKARASELLRSVETDGETYEITHRGKPVARLTPVEYPRELSFEEWKAGWDELSDRIAAHLDPWVPVDATQVVREGRR